jgi:glutaredoxin 3
MSSVRIYTTDYCSYCRAAKRFLEERGVTIEEFDVTGDDAARADLVTRTGQRTVPQIFVGATHVGGYTDMVALDRAGKLQPLLDA